MMINWQVRKDPAHHKGVETMREVRGDQAHSCEGAPKLMQLPQPGLDHNFRPGERDKVNDMRGM